MRVTGRSPRRQLEEYLQQLTEGASSGQLLELRWAPPEQPMRRRFVPASAPASAHRLIEANRESADVFIGVALRDRRSGRKSAIAGSRLLFVECDRAPEPGKLAELPPTIEIASGTPDHRHLYWRLDATASSQQAERANRGLALGSAGTPAASTSGESCARPKRSTTSTNRLAQSSCLRSAAT
jgi:hypothetical protein